MQKFTVISALIIVAALAACDFPRDAAGTYDRVREQQVLRVGVSERPPWIFFEGCEVSGIEAELVRRWASQLNAEILWVQGAEAVLVRALRERHLDLVVAGLTTQSPWRKHAAATQKCIRAAIVLATPDPSTSRNGAAERTIAYAEARPDFSAIIAASGATPRPVADVRGQAAAVYRFEAQSLGLHATEIELGHEHLLMLAPPGENRFLYEFDRFLSGACRNALSDGATP